MLILNHCNYSSLTSRRAVACIMEAVLENEHSRTMMYGNLFLSVMES
jgi:hypothetical protein